MPNFTTNGSFFYCLQKFHVPPLKFLYKKTLLSALKNSKNLSLSHPTIVMAHFPKVTGSDFRLQFVHGRLVQGPIEPPEFEFQHSSNFNFYKPNDFDFVHLDGTDQYVLLRPDLACAFWETLKMKGRYILAAANNWTGDDPLKPLPMTVPPQKLEEIHMIYPPFPPLYQLTYNFFMLLEKKDVICSCITAWQENSWQLATWICKAKYNTIRYCSKSWKWPEPLAYSLIYPEDSRYSTEDSTWSPNLSTADLSLPESIEAPIRTTRTFWAKVESDIKKRACDLSPADEHRDGEKSDKRQVVLWNPTLVQLLEMREALVFGKTNSYQSVKVVII